MSQATDSQEVVYRVSCESKGDLWYATLTEANTASYNILAGGEAVGLYPLPVPRTADEFVRFVRGYKRRTPGGLTADVADKIKMEILGLSNGGEISVPAITDAERRAMSRYLKVEKGPSGLVLTPLQEDL